MRNYLIPLMNLCCLSSIFAADGHHQKGTQYVKESIQAYIETNHGTDGGLFLDPYFRPELQNLKNAKVLDAGCGAGPWTLYAAENGAEAYGIDIQEGMVQAAAEAAKRSKLENRVQVIQGDVASLPYQSNFFDKIISICVACNLPKSSFDRHLVEIDRTLEEDGTAIIGFPTSLDVVFNDGSKSDADVFLHIQEVLNKISANPSPEVIFKKLSELTEVLSATFVIRNNKLCLLGNENRINNGEQIWRKLPSAVVPNYFYSRSYYNEELKKHNFEVLSINLPHFENEAKREQYNESVSSEKRLGSSYVTNPPFAIYKIRKTAKMTIPTNICLQSDKKEPPKVS